MTPSPRTRSALALPLGAALLLACGPAPAPRDAPPAETSKPPAATETNETPASTLSPFEAVDPMIGTGGTGHTYPGATWPFGMVQLSPDTRLDGWEGCSGYHHDDPAIYGFSHTHLSGTGVSDYGDVLLMPAMISPESLESPHEFKTTFGHANERAEAGYYAVTLDAPGAAPGAGGGVEVELTAAPRAGVHRYRFPSPEPGGPQKELLRLDAAVLIDLAHRDEVLEASLRISGERELEGMRRSKAWARDQHVYFVARFSRPFETYPAREDGAVIRGRALRADDRRALLHFGPVRGDTKPLTVVVGISSVDVDGARKNLQAEIARPEIADTFDFDGYRARARAAWSEQLAKITVTAGDDSHRRSFYTALYHTMIAPNLFEDVDGRYRGTDLQVHTSPGWTQHTVFSLWDTFRAAHPLYTIIEPERTADFVGSLIAHHRDGGALAMWELAANYTGCMIGYHAVPVIVDAHRKGVSGLDELGAEEALAAMVDSATRDHLGIDAYRERGHIPSEREHESVSKTLEYAFDDACIADMAARTGDDETAARFAARAQHWKNLHDPETGLMRPRVNGGWLEPFDPTEVNNHYTEANAWQYSFFVPHDLPGLIARHGGREAFAARLDTLFTADPSLRGRSQPDITGLIGQYAHGNEPSHHVAYLYNHAGQPWKTQARVREIIDTLYRDTPDGLPGNEDCGQMSAWYVLSALGLYPVDACAGGYELTTPRFERAVVKLAEGRELVIEAEGLSENSPYIQRVTLNDEPLTGTQLSHEQLAAGGHLRFELGPEPNKSWGTGSRALEASGGVDAPALVTAPTASPTQRSFTGELTVTLTGGAEATAIHYTLDGSAPSRDSPRYQTPLALRETTTLRAIAVAADARVSHETRSQFHRRREDWSVTLTHRYNRQYTAGGDHGVIDGLRGTTNWRAGGWQGYQPSDFEAVVDLGEVQRIRRLASGYLQDARSWIWLPKQVEYAVSSDGEHFTELGVARHDVPLKTEEVLLRELEVKPPANTRARYVRVRARNLGPIPAWHPGRGNPAFIFVDEIIVE